MIIQQKSKAQIFKSFFNAKNFMVSLMATTFLVFASGPGTLNQIEDFYSILIGTGLFTIAAGLLFWAAEISKRDANNLHR